MHRQIYKDIKRNLSKKVHEKTATSETWRSVPDGYELGDIELTIDIERVMRWLGPRALNNRTGRAVNASGAIVAKVIKRTRFST